MRPSSKASREAAASSTPSDDSHPPFGTADSVSRMWRLLKGLLFSQSASAQVRVIERGGGQDKQVVSITNTQKPTMKKGRRRGNSK